MKTIWRKLTDGHTPDSLLLLGVFFAIILAFIVSIQLSSTTHAFRGVSHATPDTITTCDQTIMRNDYRGKWVYDQLAANMKLRLLDGAQSGVMIYEPTNNRFVVQVAGNSVINNNKLRLFEVSAGSNTWRLAVPTGQWQTYYYSYNSDGTLTQLVSPSGDQYIMTSNVNYCFVWAKNLDTAAASWASALGGTPPTIPTLDHTMEPTPEPEPEPEGGLSQETQDQITKIAAGYLGILAAAFVGYHIVRQFRWHL